MEPDKREICVHCGGLHYGTPRGKCVYICDQCGLDIRLDVQPHCLTHEPAPRQSGVGERPEMNQAEWEARGEPSVVPSEAAPETREQVANRCPKTVDGQHYFGDRNGACLLCKCNCSRNPQTGQMELCAVHEAEVMDRMMEVNDARRAASKLPAPEVKLSWPSSTCVECGKEIPPGRIQRCMFGGPCNHHAPNAILAQLAAARKEIATLKHSFGNHPDWVSRDLYRAALDQFNESQDELATLRDSHDALLRGWGMSLAGKPVRDADETIARAEAMKGKP